MNKFQRQRWKDFRRRADYAPEDVYHHRKRGWEYIPVHPFADEPAVLSRLELRPEDCRAVDAWWGIDNDATLLCSRVIGALDGPAGLFAQATSYEELGVRPFAVFDAPFVTRELFEGAMASLVDAGFPHGPLFELREGRQVRLPPDLQPEAGIK